MKFFNKLFSKESPPRILSDSFEDELSPKYKLTDEGLVALVEGKLSCQPSERPGAFFVHYDTFVYDTTASKIYFSWKGVIVMELAVPVLTQGNTLTITGLRGLIPMEIS